MPCIFRLACIPTVIASRVLAVVCSQLRRELTGGGTAPGIVEGVVVSALNNIGAFLTCWSWATRRAWGAQAVREPERNIARKLSNSVTVPRITTDNQTYDALLDAYSECLRQSAAEERDKG